MQNGDKNPSWKGGKSFEPYNLDWTKTLRQSIRERDHYVCQLCNKPQQERLHCVHHIDYDKQNCNPENLITLCVGCNTKVNVNREHWTNYFQNL
jgi:5-methylcytosine-specific restriction endonuclease McrA